MINIHTLTYTENKRIKEINKLRSHDELGIYIQFNTHGNDDSIQEASILKVL